MAEVDMQCVDQVEGRIPLPSFHCLFGAKERPDPPRPGVPFVLAQKIAAAMKRSRSPVLKAPHDSSHRYLERQFPAPTS